MPETARKDRWWSTGGPWGTGLFIAGLGSVVLGLFYTHASWADLQPAFRWVSANQHVPIWAYGLLWIAAGVFGMVHALLPPQRHWHVAPIAVVMCLWAGIYVAHWLAFGVLYRAWGHDWQGGLVWGLFASMLIAWSRCVNPPRRRP